MTKKEKFQFTQHYQIDNAIALAQLSAEIYSINEKNHTDKERRIATQYDYDDALFFSTCVNDECRFADLQFILLKKDDEITVIFKGTQEKEDWKTNTNIKKANFTDDKIKVHEGFLTSFELFLETIQTSDKKLGDFKISTLYEEFLNKDSKIKFIIAGHSLGGAIATLLCAYIKSEMQKVCYTFGAPPVGWEEFYKKFKEIPLYRIVNKLDPIPHMNVLSAKIPAGIIPVSLLWKSLIHIGELKLLESDEHEHHRITQYISNLQKERKVTLKRKKIFNLKRTMIRYKWSAFLALMIITTLVFGIIGQLEEGCSLIDAFYLATAQLALDFEQKHNLNFYLEISRLSALIFVSSALLRTVYLFSYTSFVQPLQLLKNKQHIVVFGFNGHVSSLVKNINETHPSTKVVLVTMQEVDANQTDFEAMIIKEPKLLTLGFMRLLKLEKAQHVVCMDMDDDIDVKHANGIIEYLEDIGGTQNVQLHIHLNSYVLADLFNHENFIALRGKMPCDIKVFNHNENAAKILFRNVFIENEIILKGRKVHWLLNGDKNQVLDFMRYVVQISYYKDEQIPSVTLVCPDIQHIQLEIKKLFPKIDKTACIAVVDTFDKVEKPETITHIGILYENEVKGLKESLTLNNLFKETYIFLLQRESSIINNKFIIPFGSFSILNTTQIIFDEELDQKAINIHNYYRSLYEMEPWEELSLFKKNSNRMQAEHINIKLRGIGWNQKSFKDYDKFLEQNSELVKKWSRIEHLRWNAFHYINGWEYSEQRNDAKKLHNCLVDFEKLSPEDQKKDEPALTKIPFFV